MIYQIGHRAFCASCTSTFTSFMHWHASLVLSNWANWDNLTTKGWVKGKLECFFDSKKHHFLLPILHPGKIISMWQLDKSYDKQPISCINNTNVRFNTLGVWNKCPNPSSDTTQQVYPCSGGKRGWGGKRPHEIRNYLPKKLPMDGKKMMSL